MSLKYLVRGRGLEGRGLGRFDIAENFLHKNMENHGSEILGHTKNQNMQSAASYVTREGL